MLLAPTSALTLPPSPAAGASTLVAFKANDLLLLPSGAVAGRKLFVTSYSLFRLEYMQGYSMKK